MVFVTGGWLAVVWPPWHPEKRSLVYFLGNTGLCMQASTVENMVLGRRIPWESGRLGDVVVGVDLGVVGLDSNNLKDKAEHICCYMALGMAGNFFAHLSFYQKMSEKVVSALTVAYLNFAFVVVVHFFAKGNSADQYKTSGQPLLMVLAVVVVMMFLLVVAVVTAMEAVEVAEEEVVAMAVVVVVGCSKSPCTMASKNCHTSWGTLSVSLGVVYTCKQLSGTFLFQDKFLCRCDLESQDLQGFCIYFHLDISPSLSLQRCFLALRIKSSCLELDLDT